MKILGLSSISLCQKKLKEENISSKTNSSVSKTRNLMDDLSSIANLNKTIPFKSNINNSKEETYSKKEIFELFEPEDESLAKRLLKNIPEQISREELDYLQKILNEYFNNKLFTDEEWSKYYDAETVFASIKRCTPEAKKLILEDVISIDEKELKEKITELWILMDGEQPSKDFIEQVYYDSRLSKLIEQANMSSNKEYITIDGREELIIYRNGISGLTAGGHWIVFENPVDWSEPKREITFKDITNELIKEKIARMQAYGEPFEYFERVEYVKPEPIVEDIPVSSRPLQSMETSSNNNSYISV